MHQIAPMPSEAINDPGPICPSKQENADAPQTEIDTLRGQTSLMSSQIAELTSKNTELESRMTTMISQLATVLARLESLPSASQGQPPSVCIMNSSRLLILDTFSNLQDMAAARDCPPSGDCASSPR